MPAGKHVPKDGHRRNSKKVHIILAEMTDSSFIPYCSQILSRTNVLKCWTPTSLAQRGVNDASKDGKVRTVLQCSLLRLDCHNMTVRVGQASFDQNE